MQFNYDEIIERLSERTLDNSNELKKTRRQRRTEFTDMYGVPFTAQGDVNAPATFYISVSPDLEYYLRFGFKLAIQPFTSTVSGGTGAAEVTVNDTSLSVSSQTITPNPHRHDTEPHTHNVVSGITLVHTTASDFRVKIHGVDITPYLMAQQGGAWIDGEGLYPTNILEDEEDTYDILKVASDMHSEGNTTDANKLLVPEFKKVEITSNAPFQATMYVYLKHSNVGR